jgi:glutathione synthase
MKLAFVVNRVATEEPGYTTTRLALTATRQGHEVWLIGVEDFSHEPSGAVTALARSAPGKKYRSLESFLGAVQGDDATVEGSRSTTSTRWSCATTRRGRRRPALGGDLGDPLRPVRRDARGTGVNDPFSLANAVNKTYFQHFPEQIRPRTMISRDLEAIESFVKELEGSAVLKPLQGSGGAGVFLVSPDEAPNFNQMIEALGRDGYIVAQEYLDEAEKGDIRLFVMNGQPLERDGKVAAFRRKNTSEDIRSNMHVGGKAHAVKYTDELQSVVELVRPKLMTDGMFLVGLDVVGSKLMEVNVFSPGGPGQLSTALRRRLHRTRHRRPRAEGRASDHVTRPGQHPVGDPVRSNVRKQDDEGVERKA